MKVLLFAPSRSIHTHKWGIFLHFEGIEIVVVTFQNHYSREHAQEIRTISLPKRLPGKLSYFAAIFDLQKVLREEKPDLLHAHYASSYGFIASCVNFHPTIVSVWGSDIYHFPKGNFLSRYIIKRSLEKADLLCSTSHAMALEAAKYTSKKFEITPFGIDTRLFRPIDRPGNERFLVGIAKSLRNIYGYPELLQGFASFSRNHPHTELWIIGEGKERIHYERLVDELNIRDKVKFLGYRKNCEVAEIMQQLDVFILPSYQESFGVSALEAQACGVPVVVNRIGGLTETILEQVTGLVMENNQPREIATALEWMWQNPEQRLEMGKKAAAYVQANFCCTETGKNMKRLYEKVLSK